MGKVVFVSGRESLAGRKLIDKLLAEGHRVVATAAGTSAETAESISKNLTILPWNQASWFSTKTLVRETLRIHKTLDAALIIQKTTRDLRPARSFNQFSELEASDIEDVLEQLVKSSVALTRELIPCLEQTEGFLGMVVPNCTDNLDPMNALAHKAFIGFATSFIKEKHMKSWNCGLSSLSSDADSFASTIIRLWQEKPAKLRGRWFRHTEERTFLDRLTLGRLTFLDTL